jgi:uncharacterized Zn-binding protein involved in type VI secretion
MKRFVYSSLLILAALLFCVPGCGPAASSEAFRSDQISFTSANEVSGKVPVSLELTYPVGISPKVFATGWVFGARCLLNPGTTEQQDISDRVRWSGDAVFTPATGNLSRPSFKKIGQNIIVLETAYGTSIIQKQYNITTVSTEKYARVGDVAFCTADAHGCPACPHVVKGPIINGSTDVMLSGLPAARVGDSGIHGTCCGPNTFTIAEGDSEVLINGKPAARRGDMTKHCGGTGKIIAGEAKIGVEQAISAKQWRLEKASFQAPLGEPQTWKDEYGTHTLIISAQGNVITHKIDTLKEGQSSSLIVTVRHDVAPSFPQGETAETTARWEVKAIGTPRYTSGSIEFRQGEFSGLIKPYSVKDNPQGEIIFKRNIPAIGIGTQTNKFQLTLNIKSTSANLGLVKWEYVYP